MGCGATRVVEVPSHHIIAVRKGTEVFTSTGGLLAGFRKKLDKEYEKFDDSQLNEFFDNIYELLQKFEEMREEISNKMDNVLYITGGGAYKDPSFLMTLNSLLWKLSKDNQGSILKASIIILDNQFMAKGFNTTTKGKKASDNFFEMINTFNSYRNEKKEELDELILKRDEFRKILKQIEEEMASGEMEKETDQ